MVVLYNTNWWGWQIIKHWVTTSSFALPNVISEWQGNGRAVVEFCPHFGSVPPVTEALNHLIESPEARHEQLLALEQVVQSFGSHEWGSDAATRLLEIVEC